MPTPIARESRGLDGNRFRDGGAREWGLRLHLAGIPSCELPGVMLDRPPTVDGWKEAIAGAAREDVVIAMLHPGIFGTLDLGRWPTRSQEAFRSLVERGAGPLVEAERALRGSGSVSAGTLVAIADLTGRRAIAESFMGPRLSADPRLAATTVILVQRPETMDQGALRAALEGLRADAPGPVEVVVVCHGRADPWGEDVRSVVVESRTPWEDRVHAGVAESRGTSCLVVDERVTWPPGWRSRLLAHLVAWPDIGLVVGGNPGARGEMGSGAHTWPLLVPRAGLLVRRDVWALVGGLQAGLGPLTGIDLGLRARRLGFRVRAAGDVVLGP